MVRRECLPCRSTARGCTGHPWNFEDELPNMLPQSLKAPQSSFLVVVRRRRSQDKRHAKTTADNMRRFYVRPMPDSPSILSTARLRRKVATDFLPCSDETRAKGPSLSTRLYPLLKCNCAPTPAAIKVIPLDDCPLSYITQPAVALAARSLLLLKHCCCAEYVSSSFQLAPRGPPTEVLN